MFLHHTMTDAEILRTCDGCQSPHLQLVSDRLRDRVQDLQHINRLAIRARGSLDLVELLRDIGQIVELSGDK